MIDTNEVRSKFAYIDGLETQVIHYLCNQIDNMKVVIDAAREADPNLRRQDDIYLVLENIYSAVQAFDAKEQPDEAD